MLGPLLLVLGALLWCAEASAEPAEAAPPQLEQPRKVYVGAYAFQVPELDLAKNTYLLDFWVWFRWQGSDIDPTKTFELLNVYEGWNVLKTAIYTDEADKPKPDELGDGWYYQVFRIHARFARNFDVRSYPFDDHALLIAFEDNDKTVDELVYVVDTDATRIDPQLELSGWKIAKITAEVLEHEYPTNWGDPRRPAGADKYAQFRYTIHIERPVSGYLSTALIPIAIVMLITMVVFLIDPKYLEGRLGLAVMALMSAVAMQYSIQQDLPKTGFMVLLDNVYVLAYLTILLALAESAYAIKLVDRGEPKRARLFDRVGLATSGALFFGGTAVLVLIGR